MAARADAATRSTTSTPSREHGLARLRRRPRTRWPSPREIRDPERHKFTTPSGKIEIYSMALAANPDPYGLGRIPPIPTWIPPVDARSALSAACCARPSRGRARTRSTATSRCLARVDRDDVWMHTGRRRRARHRRRRSGARLQRPRRDRAAGRVTDRIAPGVVSIKEGAWFTPDARRRRHARLRQRADRRPLRAVRRHDLQHQPGRGRAGGLSWLVDTVPTSP